MNDKWAVPSVIVGIILILVWYSVMVKREIQRRDINLDRLGRIFQQQREAKP